MKLIAILLTLAVPVMAQDVTKTFTWDKNPEPDVYDYVLKVGPSPGNYTKIIPVTGALKVSVTLPVGLYYVVVCAVNTSGLTSLPSDEKAFQFNPAGQDKVPSQPKGLAKPPNLQARMEMTTDFKLWQTVCVKKLPNQPNAFARVTVEALE